jgi:hypothetical protein
MAEIRSSPVRTGGSKQRHFTERCTAVMELFLLALIILLAIAGALRWTADSRDFADWQPSDGGFRRSPREG